ncbi:MAG TPA: hypothetical protein VN871_14720, partial [Mycobacterium sp.]|nr:hypothetical protein [Mycobacterium sp.]
RSSALLASPSTPRQPAALTARQKYCASAVYRCQPTTFTFASVRPAVGSVRTVEGRSFHRRIGACLAVITVVFWLFLLGLPPSTYSRNAARSKPTDQQKTKHKGRQQI